MTPTPESTPTLDDLARTEQITAGLQAHAQTALGVHMATHHTPPFLSVDYPSTVTTSTAVRIHIPARHLDAWVDTVTVTDTTHDGDLDEVHGLLPDTGVRVVIFTTRLRLGGRPVLTAVSA